MALSHALVGRRKRLADWRLAQRPMSEGGVWLHSPAQQFVAVPRWRMESVGASDVTERKKQAEASMHAIKNGRVPPATGATWRATSPIQSWCQACRTDKWLHAAHTNAFVVVSKVPARCLGGREGRKGGGSQAMRCSRRPEGRVRMGFCRSPGPQTPPHPLTHTTETGFREGARAPRSRQAQEGPLQPWRVLGAPGRAGGIRSWAQPADIIPVVAGRAAGMAPGGAGCGVWSLRRVALPPRAAWPPWPALPRLACPVPQGQSGACCMGWEHEGE